MGAGSHSSYPGTHSAGATATVVRWRPDHTIRSDSENSPMDGGVLHAREVCFRMKGDLTMYNTKVKKTLLFITLFIVFAIACDLSVAISPSTGTAPLPTNTVIAASETFTSIPATVAPAATSTLPQTSFEGAEVFFGSLRLV